MCKRTVKLWHLKSDGRKLFWSLPGTVRLLQAIKPGRGPAITSFDRDNLPVITLIASVVIHIPAAAQWGQY
jgi:hypothetical protein